MAAEWTNPRYKQFLEQFNNEIKPLVDAEYGADDQIALDQEFANWLDSLCEEGTITGEEYDSWCYPDL